MKPATRNRVVWILAAAIVAAIWFLAARPRLHFIDPPMFLAILAAGAAALTALVWWEITADNSDSSPKDRQPLPTGDSR